MATFKQKKTFSKLMENIGTGRRSVSGAMRAGGYSPKTAKTPSQYTSSQGFKELCQEAGLTDNFLIGALTEDIEAKPGRRAKELDMGFKLKGLYSPLKVEGSLSLTELMREQEKEPGSSEK